MTFITTTELRTKSKELVTALLAGRSVRLIHRSRVVGEIKPSNQKPKVMTKKTIEKLHKLAKQLNLPKLTYKEREARYRKHIMEKYGQGLS